MDNLEAACRFEFDFAIEEVLEQITDKGYCLFPDVSREKELDLARIAAFADQRFFDRVYSRIGPTLLPGLELPDDGDYVLLIRELSTAVCQRKDVFRDQYRAWKANLLQRDRVLR
jgi:hypothetical protein